MSMLTIGIIMMIAGFIGVLICAKRQRSNPAIQPVALLCALVMLGGLGIYAYDVMSGSSGSSGMEAGRIYYCSIADRAGTTLKSVAPGKKAVYVVDPGMMGSETARKALETFKKAYGSDDVELATIEVPSDYEESGMDIFTILDAKHIDALVAANPDAGVFVMDIGLPEKANRIKALNLAPDKRPAFFLTNMGPIGGKALKKLIKDGKLAGVVTGKSGKRDPDYEPDEDKLAEAFDRLYVVVDKNNLKEHEDNL